MGSLRLTHTLKPLKLKTTLINNLSELVVPYPIFQVHLVLYLNDLLSYQISSRVYLICLFLL